MRKFESSQKDETRAQSADSSQACRKRRAFICLYKDNTELLVANHLWRWSIFLFFILFIYLTTILLQAVAWLVQFCRVTSTYDNVTTQKEY